MTASTPALRKLWRAHFDECARLSQAYSAAQQRYVESGGMTQLPRFSGYPSLPFELRGLACGAKSRKGQPCKRTDLMTNGRCKFHGGLSTGPKTMEGRHQARANLAKRWATSEPHG